MATAKMLAAKATVANFDFIPGESEAGATHLGELRGSWEAPLGHRNKSPIQREERGGWPWLSEDSC